MPGVAYLVLTAASTILSCAENDSMAQNAENDSMARNESCRYIELGPRNDFRKRAGRPGSRSRKSERPRKPLSAAAQLAIKTEALGGGFNPAEGFLTQELWGALDESPEPIVHAGAEDVVIELDIARCDVSEAEGRGAERGVVVEVDIEIFALDRPAVTERVFDAAADGRSVPMKVPRRNSDVSILAHAPPPVT